MQSIDPNAPTLLFKQKGMPHPGRLALAALRTEFNLFLGHSFATLHPSNAFQYNWHLDVLIHALDRCRKGECTRLIVNVPPRSLKSVTVSVAWPAFLLGHDPSLRIICASYSHGLSVKHSLDTRIIMQSTWYRTLFPGTTLSPDQNEKDRFATTRRGVRFATSIGGTLTGIGGDVLIVDDPLSALDGMSALSRERANSWFDQTFSTRLDDKRKGIIVVVMQRLHEDDLTGHLMNKGGFELLKLPAIATQTETWTGSYGNYCREAGDMLHPVREDAGLLEAAKRQLGSAAFAAQYQQDPLADAGGMLNLAWFCRYREPPQGATILQSWDTGIKSGIGNDPSACLTFALQEGNIYLIDACVMRLEYPELKKKAVQMAERFTPQTILIEDKASGQSLLQDLRRETLLPCVAIQPKGDKVVRMAAASAMIEAGRVLLPEYAAWLAAFEEEMARFPRSAHDDQADALSQALGYLQAKSGWAALNIRRV